MFHVSRTPFRVSFFGGGTDYPTWYRNEGGAVISTTIDKYCYITGRYQPPFFENIYRIVWAHIETVSSVQEILHPAVREGMNMMGFSGGRGVEIHYQGDLPARTGMGSSSAFANGLLLVLSALQKRLLDQETLYHKSIELEQELLRENVGSQDQVATAVGGLNVIKFGTDGKISVEPLEISSARKKELERSLMMFYTGGTRLASGVASSVIANLSGRKSELHQMIELVWQAKALLVGSSELSMFGRMLDETWKLKRSISKNVSNLHIDSIYETARNHGAIGGKLLGAGGAGFLVFFVPPDRRTELKASMEPLLHVPFRFENQGSVLIRTDEIQGDEDDNV